MAIDVPGWRARILDLMRSTGLPEKDGPLVLDALAAAAVTAERKPLIRIGIDHYDETLKDRWLRLDEKAKDGSYYLIGWFELEGQTSMAVAFWHGARGAWCSGSHLFTSDLNNQPTHYMVLPVPADSVLDANLI